MQSNKPLKKQGFLACQKSKQSSGILEKYKDVFESLKAYDNTRTLPFQRKRIDLTLSVRTINLLKKLKAKTGKPISRIIEAKFG